MKKLIFIYCLLTIAQNLYSRNILGLESSIEPRRIVNFPTAGVLPKTSFASYNGFGTFGNTMLELAYSPMVNFEIGLAYSSSNFVGTGNMDFQTLPGVRLKYRFIDETKTMPAIAVGFESQGFGFFAKGSNRFEHLSPGLFFVASRNFSVPIGMLSLHLGANYNFEENRNEVRSNVGSNLAAYGKTMGLNLYAGLEQTIGSRLSVNAEFNGNMNDDNSNFTNGKLILNTSLKYAVTSRVNLELKFEDLLGSYVRTNKWRRGVALEYASYF